MSYEFPLPNLGAGTREDQLRQLQSFLRQHVQRLNWVLRTLEQEDTGGGTQALLEAVASSEEVFAALCGRLRGKQRRENFLGGKQMICRGGPWSQGQSITTLDTELLGRYTLFQVVAGDAPTLCSRLDTTLQAPSLTLTQEEDTLTVTRSEAPITEIYGII